MEKIKKIWNIFSTVLVVLVVVFAVLLVGVRLFGLQVYNISSGSMAPTYNRYDLIYVKPTKGEDFKVGMPVTYVMNDELVIGTHRVIKVDLENRRLYTKGDANDGADATPVLFENIKGTPIFKIPLLGWVSAHIQKPPGSYIAVTVCVILLMVVFLPDFLVKNKQPKEEQPTEELEQTKTV